MRPGLFCSITVALLSFCASSLLCQSNGHPLPTAACGAGNIRFKTSAGPIGDTASPITAGKATLYVVLEGTSAGLSPTARIGLDGTWVGALHGFSFIRLSVDPGSRHLCDSLEPSINTPDLQTALYNLEAEPGKSYYLRIRVIDARNGSFHDFQPISSDEGRYLVSLSPVSISRPK